MQLKTKLEKLEVGLRKLGSVLVAFSGGVDSTFLLKVAKDQLKTKVLAVTAVSDTYPAQELVCAKRLAKKIKVRHRIIRTQELKNSFFNHNSLQRCYYCKKELFSKLRTLAKRERLAYVADGSNVDDLADYRPGVQAKRESGVVSPLQDAGLTKKDIRILSKKFKLGTWDKPALACLASRIPYGSPITKKRLKRIEQAEGLLKKNFSIKGNLRVRDYGVFSRIEVDKSEIRKLKGLTKIESLFEPLGYMQVYVDPRGYRCGSLNERIKER